MVQDPPKVDNITIHKAIILLPNKGKSHTVLQCWKQLLYTDMASTHEKMWDHEAAT